MVDRERVFVAVLCLEVHKRVGIGLMLSSDDRPANMGINFWFLEDCGPSWWMVGGIGVWLTAGSERVVAWCKPQSDVRMGWRLENRRVWVPGSTNSHIQVSLSRRYGEFCCAEE